jgi:Spy/CpxP family protein refolding chaperone
MTTACRTLIAGMMMVAVWPAAARAHGIGGPGHGGMGGAMLFPAILRTLNLTPEQRGQIEQIMKAHWSKLGPIFEQLHAANDELSTKLLAPGTVGANDLTPAIQHVGQLQQQLMQEWVRAALEARGVLTPDQLAKAAETKKRLDALRSEMRSLLGPMGPDGPMD